MAVAEKNVAGSKPAGSSEVVKVGNGPGGTVVKAAKKKLSPKESYALRTISGAKQCCSILSQRIKSGEAVNPEVLRACSTLNGALAGLIFADE